MVSRTPAKDWVKEHGRNATIEEQETLRILWRSKEYAAGERQVLRDQRSPEAAAAAERVDPGDYAPSPRPYRPEDDAPRADEIEAEVSPSRRNEAAQFNRVKALMHEVDVSDKTIAKSARTMLKGLGSEWVITAKVGAPGTVIGLRLMIHGHLCQGIAIWPNDSYGGAIAGGHWHRTLKGLRQWAADREIEASMSIGDAMALIRTTLPVDMAWIDGADIAIAPPAGRDEQLRDHLVRDHGLPMGTAPHVAHVAAHQQRHERGNDVAGRPPHRHVSRSVKA